MQTTCIIIYINANYLHMKLVCVGKGGSGKSSVSWLISQYIKEKRGYIATIDSDHNMDLTHMVGLDFDANTNTLHKMHDAFRDFVGQKEDKAWHQIVLDGRSLPQVTLENNQKDAFSKQVFIPISEEHDHAVVGLGCDDVLYSARCAHGHSAPLKYYLGLLDNARDVVVDGVAGVDMLNAGIYVGADMLCIVVEPQPNSIRVCDQIVSLAERLSMPYVIVVNKVGEKSEYLEEIQKKYAKKIAGLVPADESVMRLQYNILYEDIKQVLGTIYERILNIRSAETGLERVKSFESEKISHRS
jgi:CO dehydrogenase maturation factor